MGNGGGGLYYAYPNGGMSSSAGVGGAPSVISNSPVELQVTNLDQSVDQKEMKMLLAKMFRMHVGVMHVSTFFQSDGNLAACVRYVYRKVVILCILSRSPWIFFSFQEFPL